MQNFNNNHNLNEHKKHKENKFIMKIGGFLKQSFIDFPQTLSAVIFTTGCNFNCWYCHNPELIKNSKTEYDFEEVFNFLEKRRFFLEGVVISGGEPTLQPDLESVIVRIKNLGYKIKLDTNGSNPQTLKKLLDKNLLDYVAMDIKNSLRNYAKTICVKMFPEFYENKIKKSIEILKNGKVEYEFRTTFAPEITLEDIHEISKLVKGCKNFYLQKYNIPEHLAQSNLIKTAISTQISNSVTKIEAVTLPKTISQITPHINVYDNIRINKNPPNVALKILKQQIPNAKLRGF